MKKVMWVGLYIEIMMIIIILLLIILQQTIPDLIINMFYGGMITCFISTLFVVRENNDRKNDK